MFAGGMSKADGASSVVTVLVLCSQLLVFTWGVQPAGSDLTSGACTKQGHMHGVHIYDAIACNQRAFLASRTLGFDNTGRAQSNAVNDSPPEWWTRRLTRGVSG
jgi:hypothetical protein